MEINDTLKFQPVHPPDEKGGLYWWCDVREAAYRAARNQPKQIALRKKWCDNTIFNYINIDLKQKLQQLYNCTITKTYEDKSVIYYIIYKEENKQ